MIAHDDAPRQSLRRPGSLREKADSRTELAKTPAGLAQRRGVPGRDGEEPQLRLRSADLNASDGRDSGQALKRLSMRFDLSCSRFPATLRALALVHASGEEAAQLQ